MSLGAEQLERLAALARLRIDPGEAPALKDALERILGLAEELAAADTTGIDPLANPLDAVQPLRADTVTESNRRDAFQAIAPAVEDGLYLVPRVVE
ncbi:Asp-tRNA(Asn)/Glu-tRNA(Gln) amidotransferase subunit GatC [Pseudohaliea rubra]|uniref:Aspartyl/glutamyl-tRNA(Asn/Gln) amidotransferase subunit C n=1 Tax=Pseudohaliea rubra DSM 19751 TaxID=1265313 RepID=A0A095XU61_9GAMM|nr:Asp-tRNA(Asn)/Glu-tRNA(Gln) amidotransferase subunit GatC [Pseudohaliea rubra]KGE03211.1 Aspartyl-tRNA(Asn) amidotransferase subunit C / Glutamyl-tRNA(Gln) amidotransferase subunit C [Pseudohaliea rubra DSM 19751]